MKKIISTALAIVLFIGAAQAQTTEKKDRQQRGDRKEALHNMNLTAEQKAKFQSLREAQRKEMQDLKKSGNVNPEQRKAVHEKYKSQYQSILTPAQKEEMQKKREEWKDKGRKGKRGQGVGKKGGDLGKQAAFFKKELNLSTDQETKLKGIFQEFSSKAQNLRSDKSLSKEQKKTQMKSLANQYMSQGKAVLSPEQLKKFDAMKGKRKNKRASNV